MSPAISLNHVQEIVSGLHDCFRAQGLAFEFLVAPGGLSLRIALDEALDAGYRRILAAAGGAALRQIFEAVSGRDAELVLLPVPGAEEIARWLGLPGNFRKAAEQCLHWVPRPIDLLCVTFANGDRKLAWGMGQAGPAVEAGWRCEDRPAGPALLAMLSAARLNVPSFELDTGEERFTGLLLHFAVAGPAARLPQAPTNRAPHDSAKPVEASLAGLLPASRLLDAFSSMLEGGGFRWPLERHLSAARLRLVTDPPVNFYIDDDPVGCTPLEIAMAPAAVHLLLPNSPPPAGP